MKLHILTIVLDGMPFLPMQLATFQRLHCDWTWHIVEGAASNEHDTGWCKPQAGRLSRDGSSEFINQLHNHPRVRIYRKQLWDGKREMVNAPLSQIDEPCLLLEVDVDELWTPNQINRMFRLMTNDPEKHNCARFFCRYFVGQNLIITSINTYGNKPGEWLRLWRYIPPAKFARHEPPVLCGVNEPPSERCLRREMTRLHGLVFDHWAYVFPSQVAYKEHFYGYANALHHWQRLQRNTVWPARLGDFLPWVKDNAQVDILK